MNDLRVYFFNHESLINCYVVFAIVFVAVTVLFTLMSRYIAKRSEDLGLALEKALREYENDLYKYVVRSDGDGRYAALCEGETVLIRTPCYSSIAGVKSALKSLQGNIDSDNFSVSANKGVFTVKLYSSTKVLFESEEFSSFEEAEEYVEKVRYASASSKTITDSE